VLHEQNLEHAITALRKIIRKLAGIGLLAMVVAATVACLPLPVTGSARAADEHFYVITKSLSTGVEARRILAQNHWVSVPLRQADFALVVVRSELDFPLSEMYDNIFQPEEDADHQLNIAGSNFVVYIFKLDDNFQPIRIKRVSYPARD